MGTINMIIPTRHHFGYLLDALGLNGEGVEIGVMHGDFSKSILSRWSSGRLHLVDPWDRIEDYDDGINEMNREDDYTRCLDNRPANNPNAPNAVQSSFSIWRKPLGESPT